MSKVTLALKVSKVLLALQVPKVSKVPLVLQVLKVLKVDKV